MNLDWATNAGWAAVALGVIALTWAALHRLWGGQDEKAQQIRDARAAVAEAAAAIRAATSSGDAGLLAHANRVLRNAEKRLARARSGRG